MGPGFIPWNNQTAEGQQQSRFHLRQRTPVVGLPQHKTDLLSHNTAQSWKVVKTNTESAANPGGGFW